MKLPLVTVAAINGHCYAGGLVLALCHDYRVMNQDFGNTAMSEIKLGIPISSISISLIKAKVPDK